MADALRPGPPRGPWSLLAFTALTIPACAVLIWWLDKPLALFFHHYTGWARPFFAALTYGAEAAYDATLRNWLGWPLLWWGLALGYLLGRWVLRWRRATVLLVVLLTHVASVASANILKVLVHRTRPETLWASHPVLAWWGNGPYSDSFPSGHTATYWSLFLPLAVAFPRWRWPLLAVPTLVALGRLVLGEHYLSDVWAAIWLVAAWTTVFGLLRRWA